MSTPSAAIRFAFLLACVSALAASASASESPLPENELHPFYSRWEFRASYIKGYEEDKFQELKSISAATDLKMTHSLKFMPELWLFAPTSDLPDGRGDTYGAGFSTNLRWCLERNEDFGLFLEWGAGVALFEDDWPEGGTAFNFFNHYGLGANVKVHNDKHIIFGVRHTHVSNGRGITPDNPSFNGLGAYFGVAIPRKREFEVTREEDTADLQEWQGREEGIHASVDGLYGRVDGSNYYASVVSVDLPVSETLNLHGELEAGKLSSEEVIEGGLGLSYRTLDWRISGYASHKTFGDFDTTTLQGQVDYAATDYLMYSGSLEHAFRDTEPHNHTRAAMYLRLYMFDLLMVESGLDYDGVGAGGGQHVDDINLHFAAELSPNLGNELFNISFFYHKRIEDLWEAGIRLSFSGDISLFERDWARSWRRVR